MSELRDQLLAELGPQGVHAAAESAARMSLEEAIEAASLQLPA